MKRVTMRIEFDDSRWIGWGKVALLDAIARDGSITTAAKSLGMSYRRAWQLVHALNTMFQEPLVQSDRGGTDGGGTTLTPLGQEVVTRYRRVEGRLNMLTQQAFHELEQRLAPPRTPLTK